jgi:tetratricopeptide (TPR) repeat protein
MMRNLPFVAVGALVIGIFAFSANPTILELVGGKASDAYYNLLVEGLRSGRLTLNRAAPPELAKLADPYDPVANAAFRAAGTGIHDVSYYHGKLYLYFGITPALILFWPWFEITGHYLHHQWAVVIFCAAGFVVGAALLRALWRRYFPDLDAWIAAGGMLAFGLAASAPILLQRADVWEVAIACGHALILLALAALWRALLAPSRAGRWLAVASAALGLAVGARPSLLVDAAILAVPIAAAWTESRRRKAAGETGERLRLARQIAAAAVPLALCGLGLALYNFMRFGNPLEFGQTYQLAGDRQSLGHHFSLRYLGYNLRVYFLEPAQWNAHFPYFRDLAPPPAPPGHAPAEDPFGILLNVPLVVLAFAAPLAWRGRSAGFAAPLRWFIVAVAWVFGSSALILDLFYGNCSRYEFEFLPPLVFLAVIGIFALDSALAGRPGWRLGSRLGWGALLGFSIAFNLLTAFDHHAGWRCDMGNFLFRRGQTADAIAQYQAALRVEPSSARVRNNLGLALLRLGRTTEAREQFELALRYEPDFAAAHRNLADLLADSHLWSEAVGQYEAALRLDPGNAETHFNLSLVLSNLGRDAEAEAQFREAVRLRPDIAPRPFYAP